VRKKKGEEHKLFLEWRSTPPNEREPATLAGFSRLTGVSQVTLYKWDKSVALAEGDAVYNSESWLESQTQKADEALVKACEKNNAQALKIFYQINKRLIEQREDTLKLDFSANDYTQIGNRVKQQLRDDFQEFGGICPVCFKSQALRREICVDTESKQPEDREVATLALPA